MQISFNFELNSKVMNFYQLKKKLIKKYIYIRNRVVIITKKSTLNTKSYLFITYLSLSKNPKDKKHANF